MILSVTYDARAQIILLTCQLSVSADDKNAFFSCLSPGGHVVLDGASLKVAAVDLSNQSAAAAAASAMPFKGRASSISTVSTASSAAANATAQFTVSVLPTAMDQLTLARKRVGSQVNVEIDLLGKHILRSVEVTLRDQLQQASEGEEDEMHKTGLEKIIEREVVKVLEKKGLLGKAAHVRQRLSCVIYVFLMLHSFSAGDLAMHRVDFREMIASCTGHNKECYRIGLQQCQRSDLYCIVFVDLMHRQKSVSITGRSQTSMSGGLSRPSTQ